MRRLHIEISALKPAAPTAPEAADMPQLVIPVVKESPSSVVTESLQSTVQVVEAKSLADELQAILQEVPQAEHADLVLTASSVDAETGVPPAVPQTAVVQPPPPPPPRKPSFMERNPDMEKFIGENLISKIGIAILVLAIGYFVKYAIDNDWIGPVGRVGIGIGFGGILVALAHRMRKSYQAFSSVLAGGGLAIFYFTITLAYHQFHLFSQTVSFVIMLVITAFAVALSQLYNRQELAIIALIGGFATPFMVSNGSDNYKALFWYLIILNAGLLAIAYNKAWRLLNLLAFLFTVILFGGWLFTLKDITPPATYRDGIMYATVFYLLFFLINIAHNIRENRKFLASDFSILLANTALYFAAGIYCLSAMHASEYKGLFTASISVFNLATTYFLFRKQKLDKNILYLLISITLSFISLTAPIQLNGHNITLFWASEAVLLYWLFQKSKISIIRYGSYLVWMAMLVSLLMDWFNVYMNQPAHVSIIANKAFITGLCAAIASYLLFYLKNKDPHDVRDKSSLPSLNIIFRVTGIVLLFLSGFLEINYQFNWYYPYVEIHIVYLLLYLFVFVLVFSFIARRTKNLQMGWLVTGAFYAGCVLVFLFNIPALFRIQRDILQGKQLPSLFIAQWLAALLLAVIIYRLIRLLQTNLQPTTKITVPLTWIICAVCIIFLGAEIHLVVNQVFFDTNHPLDRIQEVYIKTGLPIVWGLGSFCFMWLGMKHTFRPLRIISLTLFLLTLLKLFIFDIRNIPATGKIAAFFSLGVLLLVVSFMYQRLKKIIIADEKTPDV